MYGSVGVFERLICGTAGVDVGSVIAFGVCRLYAKVTRADADNV